MNYFTAKQAAEKWGITANRVTILCKGGKIPGAMQIGSQWMIPNGTEKPKDGRTKEVKMHTKDNLFRFPLYVNADENKFSPPLNNEELLLRKAQLDYYSCNFDTAKKIFCDLSESTGNIYIKIMSLFYLCSLCVEVYGGENLSDYFQSLQIELKKEFPHKRDMSVVTPWIYTITVQLQSVSSSLKIEPLYEYSTTVQPMISYLSFYHLLSVEQSKRSDLHFDVYEMLCRDFLYNGHYYEACELHFALFFAYYVLMKNEAMFYHLRKGLELVMEHKFYIIAASYEFYYENAFDIVFKEFPEDFVKLIKHYSEIISISVGKFAQKYNITNIFKILSKSDYRYLVYAFQGNTNKEIARALNISERTVANRYSEIYNKLGISSKHELTDLLADSCSIQ